MADLVWAQVAADFDLEANGVLPDLAIDGVGVAGWQALLDLIVEQGWSCRYEADGEVLPLPAAARLLEDVRETGAMVKVWPLPYMQVNFWPYAPESIDFDVDLRELQGQQRLDDFCGFLRTLGRRLGKAIVMTPEGQSTYTVLRFDPAADRVVLGTPPPSTSAG